MWTDFSISSACLPLYILYNLSLHIFFCLVEECERVEQTAVLGRIEYETESSGTERESIQCERSNDCKAAIVGSLQSQCCELE